MTCKKNNNSTNSGSGSTTTATSSDGTVRIPAIISKLQNIKHLAKGYLEKSRDLFALEEAIRLGNMAKMQVAGEEEMEESSVIDLPEPFDIDDELLLDQGLTVRTGGISGGNNMLIYAALAATGIYLLFKN